MSIWITLFFTISLSGIALILWKEQKRNRAFAAQYKAEAEFNRLFTQHYGIMEELVSSLCNELGIKLQSEIEEEGNDGV